MRCRTEWFMAISDCCYPCCCCRVCSDAADVCNLTYSVSIFITCFGCRNWINHFLNFLPSTCLSHLLLWSFLFSLVLHVRWTCAVSEFCLISYLNNLFQVHVLFISYFFSFFFSSEVSFRNAKIVRQSSVFHILEMASVKISFCGDQGCGRVKPLLIVPRHKCRLPMYSTLLPSISPQHTRVT